MKRNDGDVSRRRFLGSAAVIPAAFVGVPALVAAQSSADADVFVLGQREGYSPQIGTLVSMLTMMRVIVLASLDKGMTLAQVDYLHDGQSNSIGAMLLHLAATERYYQLNTFDSIVWDRWDDAIKKEWDVAMNLGAQARSQLKGRPLDHYLGILEDVREKSLARFKQRDDAWLMSIDKTWPWGPTNNYAKWFHVCEHESNHNGQIKWIAGRLPGARPNIG